MYISFYMEIVTIFFSIHGRNIFIQVFPFEVMVHLIMLNSQKVGKVEIWKVIKSKVWID